MSYSDDDDFDMSASDEDVCYAYQLGLERSANMTLTFF